MRWFDLAPARDFVRCVALVLVLSLAGCRSPKFECEYLGNLGEWTDSVSTSLEPSSFFPTWPQDIAVHDSLSLYDSKRRKSYRYIFKHNDIPQQIPFFAKTIEIPYGGETEGICFVGEKNPSAEFFVAFADEKYSDLHLYKFRIR